MIEFSRRFGHIAKDFLTREPENSSAGVLFVGGMLGTVAGVGIDAVTNNFLFSAIPDGAVVGFLLLSRLAASWHDGTQAYYTSRFNRRRTTN